MPKNRELTLAARAYQAFAGSRIKYTQAREKIVELSAASGETYDELRIFFLDHGNKMLCANCGWRVKDVCPQCAGCGCVTTCDDYRHDESRAEVGNDEGHIHYSGYGEDVCPDCGGTVDECDCDTDRDTCRECGSHVIYGCTCENDPDIDDYDYDDREQEPDYYYDEPDDEPEPDDYVLPDEPPADDES